MALNILSGLLTLVAYVAGYLWEAAEAQWDDGRRKFLEHERRIKDELL